MTAVENTSVDGGEAARRKWRLRGAVVIPAAGKSSRMGFPKQLLLVGGVPLIRRVVCRFLEAFAAFPDVALSDFVVVTGYYRNDVEDALKGLPVRPAFNPDHHLDMAVSLRVGFRALGAIPDFILTTPGDYPHLAVEAIRTLISAYVPQEPDRILLPVFQDRKGHPILLPGRAAAQFSEAPPDWTLRDLVVRGPYPLALVPVTDPGVTQDLDSPEDLQKVDGLSGTP